MLIRPEDLPDPPTPIKATRLDKVVVEFETMYHRFLSVKKKLNTFAKKTTKNN